MGLKQIAFDSLEYQTFLSLREKILRKPLGLEFSKQDLMQEVQQIHFVFEQNKKILGGLIFVPISQDILKMRQVCVDNTYQSQGIGKKMILESEKWARQNNYSEIFCHARKTALSFYKNLDYKQESELFYEIGIEHYRLRKKV